MSNKIILKKSSVGAKVPLTTDLVYGELALNYADGKLYYKDASNNIQNFTDVNGVTSLINSAKASMTLASVTTNGNTTTNSITVGSLSTSGAEIGRAHV